MPLLSEVAGDPSQRVEQRGAEEGCRDPGGKADRKRDEGALGEVGGRSTAATESAAIGPNSGPTTIAPMIRMIWSVRMPTAAIITARTMKARKLAESSTSSEVRDSTSSQTTASEDDVAHRPLPAEELEGHLGAVRRRHDPHVDHARKTSGAPPPTFTGLRRTLPVHH